jgi:PAS domain S-box-containing protein
LTYSLDEAEAIARSYLYDYMVDGAIVTLLLMTLILLVMRRPLRMLRDAAAFARGLQERSGKQIELDGRSIELEQLGQALNQASSSLFEQEGTIKRAFKALNTQKSALDEHSIVSITDVDGNITYANQKFLDATGFSNEELLGKNHRIIKSGFHDHEFFRNMWSTIAAGRVWHGEIVNRVKDGRELWLKTTIVPFMDESGHPYEYVAIRTDISGQKKIERELEEKARSLEQMTGNLEGLVRHRTAELEEANRQLQHLNKIKSEFVAVVSHELRTPLTSIKSFAEILRDDLDEIDGETQKRFLTIINDESERLGRLINELLDLQKIDSGKMVWNDKPVSLAAVLQGAVEFFSQAYRDKGLQLRLELAAEECQLDLDVDRIRQLITNLLANALKFTECGTVTVTMSIGSDEVKVAVSDSGIGIPTDEIDKVFESFHQVDSSETRRIGGSGLGLAICKEIVEHYRGRIWVESRFGEGSCFSFTLPLFDRERPA